MCVPCLTDITEVTEIGPSNPSDTDKGRFINGKDSGIKTVHDTIHGIYVKRGK